MVDTEQPLTPLTLKKIEKKVDKTISGKNVGIMREAVGQGPKKPLKPPKREYQSVEEKITEMEVGERLRQVATPTETPEEKKVESDEAT